MQYNLAPNEPFHIKRGGVTVDVPLSESGTLATEKSLFYDIKDAETSTSGTILTATLFDRTINKITVTDGVTEVVFDFPSEILGKSRDFKIVLTCGTTPPSISYLDYGEIYKGRDVSLDPQAGINIYSFTEFVRNQFSASREMIEVANTNLPSSIEMMMSAMQALGYDTSSFATLEDVRVALSLPEAATIQDAIQKLIF